MWEDIVLIHRVEPVPFALRPALPDKPEQIIVWRTCLRQIALTQEPYLGFVEIRAGDAVFRGEAAYRFLLEVICGLHSELLGENEIAAQFKQRFLTEAPAVGWSEKLARLVPALLTDMRKIRRAFALNSGTHSYGSFCRKETQTAASVMIVGTGELTESILPWLGGSDRPLAIGYRRSVSREKIARKFPGLEFHSVERALAVVPAALIVAAPMTAADLRALFPGETPSIVIDFRADSAIDGLSWRSAKTITLPDFFARMKTQSGESRRLRRRADAEITKLCALRAEVQSILIRPLGWEDLCG